MPFTIFLQNSINGYANMPVKKKSEIIPLICSVRDEERIDMIFQMESGYSVSCRGLQHVPLVEYNVAEGIKNNILGTLNVVHHSIKYGTFDFVLISTDKAVRPTNVMGATKEDRRNDPAGFMEQWCNKYPVINGSFWKRFRFIGFGYSQIQTQIRDGGPVTVTHPDVTRYL